MASAYSSLTQHDTEGLDKALNEWCIVTSGSRETEYVPLIHRSSPAWVSRSDIKVASSDYWAACMAYHYDHKSGKIKTTLETDQQHEKIANYSQVRSEVIANSDELSLALWQEDKLLDQLKEISASDVKFIRSGVYKISFPTANHKEICLQNLLQSYFSKSLKEKIFSDQRYRDDVFPAFSLISNKGDANSSEELKELGRKIYMYLDVTVKFPLASLLDDGNSIQVNLHPASRYFEEQETERINLDASVKQYIEQKLMDQQRHKMIGVLRSCHLLYEAVNERPANDFGLNPSLNDLNINPDDAIDEQRMLSDVSNLVDNIPLSPDMRYYSAYPPHTGNKPLQIVTFEPTKLHEKELETIMQSREGAALKMPISVVSIGGVARSGKSFLLNLMVTYLSYLETHGNDEGWETSPTEVKGVNWANNEDAITSGIWMWEQPFIVTGPMYKIAVLLVDSQGVGDTGCSNPMLDTFIMLISLHLSSVLILNVDKFLRADELSSLELCADYADAPETSLSSVAPEERQKLFQRLVFLVRNFETDDESKYGEDQDRFYNIANKCKGKHLTDVCGGIKKAFGGITTYRIPHPGRDIARGSHYTRTWVIKDIPDDFMRIVKVLCQNLFHKGSIELKCSESATILKGEKYLETFKAIKRKFESAAMPKINSPKEALQELVMFKAYSEAQHVFALRLRHIEKTMSIIPSPEELRALYSSAQAMAINRFYKSGMHTKYEKTSRWKEYENMLKQSFNDEDRLLLLHGFAMKESNLKKQIDEGKELLKELERATEIKIADLQRKFDEVEKNRKADEKKFKRKESNLEEQRKKGDKRLGELFNEIKQLREDFALKTENYKKEKEGLCNEMETFQERLKEYEKKNEGLFESLEEAKKTVQKIEESSKTAKKEEKKKCILL